MLPKDRFFSIREGISVRRNSSDKDFYGLNKTIDNKSRENKETKTGGSSLFFHIAVMVSGLSFGASVCFAVLNWM